MAGNLRSVAEQLAGQGLLSFGLVFFIMVGGFAVAATILFGHQAHQYATVPLQISFDLIKLSLCLTPNSFTHTNAHTCTHAHTSTTGPLIHSPAIHIHIGHPRLSAPDFWMLSC
jgi:hypothetical protein